MRFRLAFGACFLVLASLSAGAQAPATIGHQGVLTTSGGAPVADGTYSLTFRLYSASTGGIALWTETHSAVSVSNGCQYCTASHGAAAKRLGMSKEMLGELIALVGMANQTNRLADGYRVPVDERFENLF